jgi:hypothetical protein
MLIPMSISPLIVSCPLCPTRACGADQYLRGGIIVYVGLQSLFLQSTCSTASCARSRTK